MSRTINRPGILSALSRWADRNFHLIMPAPAVLCVIALGGFPLIFTFWLSGHHWVVSTKTPPMLNGLGNFAFLATDVAFWKSVARMFYFTVVGLIVQLICGLGIALLLDREFVGRGLARTLLLLPMMATPAAVAMVWAMIMNANLGVLDYILSLFGIDKILWLADPSLVILSLVVVDSWEWIPLVALFCMAGLAVIPREPYEAARIDGANAWQQFWHVTIPFLRPILVVAMLFRGVDALKSFDVFYVMTQGGPGTASQTLNLYIFQQAFSYFNMGYASALLVVFLAIILGVSLILISVRRGRTIGT